MRRVLAVGVLVALTACTPAQHAAWLDWNAKDPTAAQAWLATPDGQATLDDVPEPEVPHDESGLTNNHAARWDRIARCESGGRWDFPPVKNRTGVYSGGLMIWTKAWISYGGQQYATQAWMASKAQQIDIAERILADQGWGAWDCRG